MCRRYVTLEAPTGLSEGPAAFEAGCYHQREAGHRHQHVAQWQVHNKDIAATVQRAMSARNKYIIIMMLMRLKSFSSIPTV